MTADRVLFVGIAGLFLFLAVLCWTIGAPWLFVASAVFFGVGLGVGCVLNGRG